jgi:hypothetical protein
LRDLEQLVELFGPDFESQVIHLSQRRATRISRGGHDYLEEIQQAVSGVELDPDSATMSQEEMVKAALMLRAYTILFPALQT